VPANGAQGTKHAAFIDDIIKSLLSFTVTYLPILIFHSTIRLIPLKLRNNGYVKFAVPRWGEKGSR